IFDASVHSPTSPAHGAVNHLSHGWRLGGILQYYSTLPFNIVTGTTSLQGTTLRPCVGGVLTPSCRQALPGTVIGRNAGIGFDFFSLNARLSRTFSLTDRIKLEGIAEAFNALNHRNDMIPNGTWGTGAYPSTPNSTFGRATAVGDPRQVQLAMRLTF
ncbi:MAG TPA: hypothetical protein VK608_07345, partial [Edaphobacter sp.]|nr:hypothetical protein [Edaphobacter sp.]